MINLLEDRPCIGDSKNTIFLKAGSYDKLRMIPGLGWLVDIGFFKKTLQTTVVRFEDGVDDEA